MRLTYRNYRIAINCQPTFSLAGNFYELTNQAWTFLVWNNQGLLVHDDFAVSGVTRPTFKAAIDLAISAIDSLVQGDFTEPTAVAVSSPF